MPKPYYSTKFGNCECCNRKCELTFHHLIPRFLHKKKWFKKNYTRDQLNTGIDICRDCHDGIHDIYDEKTLGKEFNTKEKILHDPQLKKHFAWVAKQKIQ